MDFQRLKEKIPSTPAFILDEAEIRCILNILEQLRRESGCKILYSIKSLPFETVLRWLIHRVDGFSVSSLFEARFADEILADRGSLHLTTPGLRCGEIEEISQLCSHISFNSVSQYNRLSAQTKGLCSRGLRVNPKLSFLSDDRYDPCRKYSKLGIDVDEFIQSAQSKQIEGLHFHNIYAYDNFDPLIKTVEKIRSGLQGRLSDLKWLNLGGGYLFNQAKDNEIFIDLVSKLKNDFQLEIFIEPGKAVVGQAGYLVATVIDQFDSDGRSIIVLDTSVNHHPEVFEYQQKPELVEEDVNGKYAAILVGSTCLAGDIFGEYVFNKPPVVGNKVIFKNIGAYSLIKANRFNGYNLPDVFAVNAQTITKLKEYTYQDYRRQWMADKT